MRIQYLGICLFPIARGDPEGESERLFDLHLPALRLVAQRLRLRIPAGPDEEDEAAVAEPEGLDVELAGIGVHRLH